MANKEVMKTDRIFVVPKEGLKVMHPEKIGSFMPKEGAWVQNNYIWQRRISEGDVSVPSPQPKDPQLDQQEETDQTKEGMNTQQLNAAQSNKTNKGA